MNQLDCCWRLAYARVPYFIETKKRKKKERKRNGERGRREGWKKEGGSGGTREERKDSLIDVDLSTGSSLAGGLSREQRTSIVVL